MGNKKYYGAFIPPEILHSKAYKDLRKNGTSILVLSVFLSKTKKVKVRSRGRKKWELSNNGEINLYLW